MVKGPEYVHTSIMLCCIVVHKYCFLFFRLSVCSKPAWSRSIGTISQQHYMFFIWLHWV